jgi:hypothetical protein
MDSTLHDIVHGLTIARAHAEAIANDVETTDPQAASTLRRFTEELWDVWVRYQPLLPSNQNLYRLRNSAQRPV